MAQLVKVPAAKPDNLNSIPGTWKEKIDACQLSSDLHVDAIHVAYTQNNILYIHI